MKRKGLYITKDSRLKLEYREVLSYSRKKLKVKDEIIIKANLYTDDLLNNREKINVVYKVTEIKEHYYKGEII